MPRIPSDSSPFVGCSGKADGAIEAAEAAERMTTIASFAPGLAPSSSNVALAEMRRQRIN
jgi:hypothetical protein